MAKQILVNSRHYETRVAVLEDGEITSLQIEREEDRNVVGNIYKGLVKRVLPGMQAAFLELGLERTAFLYVDDIIEQPLDDVEFEDEEIGDGEEFRDDSDTQDGADSDEPESLDGAGSLKADLSEGEPRTDSGDERAPRERPVRAERRQDSASSGPRRPPPQARRGGGRGRKFQSRRQRNTVQIQDLIKEGQEVLVQVAKAPIGTKGARLTTHISLPGRNIVLMPTLKHIGISRRVENDKERRRLRDIFLRKIQLNDVGVIVRTVAAGKQFKDLKADVDYLMNLWETIKKDNKRMKAPALIHEDLSLAMRSVRDYFTDDVDSFVVDDPKLHEESVGFIGQFMPRLKARVKLFRGPSQLFEHYGIEPEISRALGKKVWLKSGGYLLIDQSDALTAIDVNTGRYVGSKSLEETILKTNLEAVREVAYQLRIRNLGGIIIIDLIDMEESQNREKVFRALRDSLGEDKARTNILKISDLGLVEMTRKRTSEDLVRYLTETCSNCDGRGYHKSKQTICFEIFREIEKESNHSPKSIVVFANPEVAEKMTKAEKTHLAQIQERLSLKVNVKEDKAFHVEQYEVFGKH